jgi:hypothetical protein
MGSRLAGPVLEGRVLEEPMPEGLPLEAQAPGMPKPRTPRVRGAWGRWRTALTSRGSAARRTRPSAPSRSAPAGRGSAAAPRGQRAALRSASPALEARRSSAARSEFVPRPALPWESARLAPPASRPVPTSSAAVPQPAVLARASPVVSARVSRSASMARWPRRSAAPSPRRTPPRHRRPGPAPPPACGACRSRSAPAPAPAACAPGRRACSSHRLLRS